MGGEVNPGGSSIGVGGQGAIGRGAGGPVGGGNGGRSRIGVGGNGGGTGRSAAPLVTHAQILAAVDKIVADQAAAVAAAVAPVQANLDAATATVTARDLTIIDLNSRLAAAQVIVDQDGVTIADLRANLAAVQTDNAALEAQHLVDLETIADLRDQLGQQDPPPTKTKFGWFPGYFRYPNSPVETKPQMRARTIAAFGCPPPVERIFNEGSWAPPPSDVPAILSVTQDPTRIANGEFDAQITALCQADWSGWITPNHECDQTTRSYTPAAQKAGLAHFSQVVRAAGNPRVKVCMILMAWTLSQGSADHWRDWYPGPEYVDALGWDCYWRPTLPHTAQDIYGLAYAVTQGEGKDFLVCETSMGAQGSGGWMDSARTIPVPEAARTQFVGDAISWLDGKATAVTWFETNKVDGNWLLEGHPEALQMWKTAVAASLA